MRLQQLAVALCRITLYTSGKAGAFLFSLKGLTENVDICNVECRIGCWTQTCEHSVTYTILSQVISLNSEYGLPLHTACNSVQVCFMNDVLIDLITGMKQGDPFTGCNP